MSEHKNVRSEDIVNGVYEALLFPLCLFLEEVQFSIAARRCSRTFLRFVSIFFFGGRELWDRGGERVAGFRWCRFVLLSSRYVRFLLYPAFNRSFGLILLDLPPSLVQFHIGFTVVF